MKITTETPIDAPERAKAVAEILGYEISEVKHIENKFPWNSKKKELAYCEISKGRFSFYSISLEPHCVGVPGLSEFNPLDPAIWTKVLEKLKIDLQWSICCRKWKAFNWFDTKDKICYSDEAAEAVIRAATDGMEVSDEC